MIENVNRLTKIPYLTTHGMFTCSADFAYVSVYDACVLVCHLLGNYLPTDLPSSLNVTHVFDDKEHRVLN